MSLPSPSLVPISTAPVEGPEVPPRPRLVPATLAGILAVHLGAAAAPFTFTPAGLSAFLVLYVLTGLGVTLGYHRFLTHHALETPRPLGYLFTFFGCLAFQFGPLQWVAVHRYHHRESDRPFDPHSPRTGLLWSHVLWLFHDHPDLKDRADFQRYAPDVARDRVLDFLERAFYPINLLFAAGMFGLGWAIGGPGTGLSLLVWGVFLRIVCVWHATWMVNSVTHRYGYQNYNTGDDSRNLWWVAFLSLGEGWHNNHHADPRSAAHGHRWFEFDLTYLVIRALRGFGLAWAVQRPRGSPWRPGDATAGGATPGGEDGGRERG